MAEPHLFKKIEIPSDLSRDARIALADEIVSFIKERTDRNLDINGAKFAAYSPEYVASADFKAAGKSKGDVNLRLTNEMMDSIQVLDISQSSITIGFDAGSPANDKGVWNQASDNGPSRKFLGVNEKDLEKLIAKVKIETSTVSTEQSNSIANAILRSFGF